MQSTYATPTGQQQYKSNDNYNAITTNDNNTIADIPQENYYHKIFHPSTFVAISTTWILFSAIALYRVAKKSDYGTGPQRNAMFIVLFCIESILLTIYTVASIIRWLGYPNYHFKYHEMNKYTLKAIRIYQPNACMTTLSMLFTAFALISTLIAFIMYLRVMIILESSSWTENPSTPTTGLIIQQMMLTFAFFVQINQLLNEFNRKYKKNQCAKLTGSPLTDDNSINYSL